MTERQTVAFLHPTVQTMYVHILLGRTMIHSCHIRMQHSH